MAKYLDKTGLDTFWAKIKNTFQTLGNKVTSVRATSSASDDKYPSEKAVASAISGKANTDLSNITDTAFQYMIPKMYGFGYFSNIATGYALLATINTTSMGDNVDVHAIFRIQYLQDAGNNFHGDQKLCLDCRHGTSTTYAYYAHLLSYYNNSPLISIKVYRTGNNDIRVYGVITGGYGKYQSVICRLESCTGWTSQSAYNRITFNRSSASSTAPTGTEIPVTAVTPFAPLSHASSATTYGVGTASNYGHVKLYENDDVLAAGTTAEASVATGKAHKHNNIESVARASVTTADLAHSNQNTKAHMILSQTTSQTSSTHKPGDGYMLTFMWDGSGDSGAFDTQLYVPNGNSNLSDYGRLKFRTRGGANTTRSWGDWEYLPAASTGTLLTSSDNLNNIMGGGKGTAVGYQWASTSVPSNSPWNEAYSGWMNVYQTETTGWTMQILYRARYGVYQRLYRTLNGTTAWTPWAKMIVSTDVMTGATSSANGTVGLVPAPTSAQRNNYLKGDGTWATPTDTKVTQSQNYTESTEFPVLFKNTANTTDETSAVKYSPSVKIVPKQGRLIATNVYSLKYSSGYIQGTSGTAGFVNFMDVECTTYMNDPFIVEVLCRGYSAIRLEFQFLPTDNKKPTFAYIMQTSFAPNGSQTNGTIGYTYEDSTDETPVRTYHFWLQKNEAWGHMTRFIRCGRWDFTQNNLKAVNVHSNTAPEGITYVSKKSVAYLDSSITGNAGTATKPSVTLLDNTKDLNDYKGSSQGDVLWYRWVYGAVPNNAPSGATALMCVMRTHSGSYVKQIVYQAGGQVLTRKCFNGTWDSQWSDEGEVTYENYTLGQINGTTSSGKYYKLADITGIKLKTTSITAVFLVDMLLSNAPLRQDMGYLKVCSNCTNDGDTPTYTFRAEFTRFTTNVSCGDIKVYGNTSTGVVSVYAYVPSSTANDWGHIGARCVLVTDLYNRRPVGTYVSFSVENVINQNAPGGTEVTVNTNILTNRGDFATGSANGTISVAGTDVAVKGLNGYSIFSAARGDNQPKSNIPGPYKTSASLSIPASAETWVKLDTISYPEKLYIGFSGPNDPCSLAADIYSFQWSSGRSPIRVTSKAGYWQTKDSKYPIEKIGVKYNTSTGYHQVYILLYNSGSSAGTLNIYSTRNSAISPSIDSGTYANSDFVDVVELTQLGGLEFSGRYYQRTNKYVIDSGDVVSTYSATGTAPVNGTAVASAIANKQDKFVALVGESGANDGSLFNDIKSAWSKNQDIVARRVVSGTENALFQLVKTIFTNGEVSGFVFQRSFPDVGQTGSYARGQLEKWTRTASKWEQTFETVEYAENCGNAVTADIATAAVTANDYSNSGTIKSALDSKQNAYEITIGSDGNNDGSSFADVGAAYTQNKRLTVRKVESTYISYFELVKVEYTSGSPSKFIFQRSYPEQEFYQQQTTFIRGQLEQWSRTSSKWEQMFVTVEFAGKATLADSASGYVGGTDTIKNALDSKMPVTATALLSPSGSGMISSYISPTLLCIMPEVLRYTGSGNPHGQVLGTDTDMRTWINIEKFIDWAVSAPYRKVSGQIYAILNYSGSNIMFTTGNAVGYGNTFLSINDEMFFVCFYNTEYHILDV